MTARDACPNTARSHHLLSGESQERIAMLRTLYDTLTSLERQVFLEEAELKHVPKVTSFIGAAAVGGGVPHAQICCDWAPAAVPRPADEVQPAADDDGVRRGRCHEPVRADVVTRQPRKFKDSLEALMPNPRMYILSTLEAAEARAQGALRPHRTEPQVTLCDGQRQIASLAPPHVVRPSESQRAPGPHSHFWEATAPSTGDRQTSTLPSVGDPIEVLHDWHPEAVAAWGGTARVASSELSEPSAVGSGPSSQPRERKSAASSCVTFSSDVHGDAHDGVMGRSSPPAQQTDGQPTFSQQQRRELHARTCNNVRAVSVDSDSFWRPEDTNHTGQPAFAVPPAALPCLVPSAVAPAGRLSASTLRQPAKAKFSIPLSIAKTHNRAYQALRLCGGEDAAQVAERQRFGRHFHNLFAARGYDSSRYVADAEYAGAPVINVSGDSHNAEALRAWFTELDQDGDGFLPSAQFTALLRSLDRSFGDENHMAAMEQHIQRNSTESGLLSFDAFAHVVTVMAMR